MYDISRLLRDNPYPGRGIVLGRSGDDRCSVLAYFIMGRSANSRNRVCPDGRRHPRAGLRPCGHDGSQGHPL